MAELSFQSIAGALVSQVPEFAGVLREHIADYDEGLPHVLFGDFTRFLIHEVKANGIESEVAGRCLRFLEQCASSSDASVRELVAVSFVEHLDPRDPVHHLIRSRAGPRLERLIGDMWGN